MNTVCQFRRCAQNVESNDCSLPELIKAFAAKATEAALQTVQTYGQKYNALIEDDQQIHANEGAF